MKKKAEIVQWKIPQIPEEKKLKSQSVSLLAHSNSFVIKSEDHFVASWAIVQEIDRAYAVIESQFEPFVSGLYRLHRLAIKMRDGFLDPLDAAKQRLLAIRGAYRDEQERLKAKADAAAAELLRKQQQKDLEKQAKAAEKSGQPEVAAALREEKAQAPLLFFNSAPAVPKQEGEVLTERWVFEIVDPALVEREYCSPDPKLIRPVVERLGPQANISGIAVRLEKSAHSRTVA